MCLFNEKQLLYSRLKVATLVIFKILILYVSESWEIRQGKYYILLWTNSKHTPFTYFKKGQEYFTENQCLFRNCFISNTISHLSNVTKYDAILFNAMTLKKKPFHKLPKKRAENQKYILVSTKSAVAYPITDRYNNFFNWTWTYKLDSDINFAYLAIRDKKDKAIIGPKNEMHWMDEAKMKKTSKKIKIKLNNKRKAAAWITSNCETVSQYESYIQKLKKELHKHKYVLDIFGPCGNRKCSHKRIQNCFALLESNYYFYLAFEDSIADDYVTNHLLTALYHYTVPVVFGGANYSRFMPDGIYLDGLELGPTKLGKVMHKIISHQKSYYDMFKWHKHYSFHNPLHSPDTNGVCQLCETLNNDDERVKLTVYENIVKWFNERRDWDVWNTRKRNLSEISDKEPKTRKSTRKHAVNKHIKSSDDNNSEKYESDSETVHKQAKNSYKDKRTEESERNKFIEILDDGDDDEGEIISIDENNLKINDFITEYFSYAPETD